jgi:cobalt-precorrin 5A hydrolase
MASDTPRPIRVAALTPQGADLARRLVEELPDALCYLPGGQVQSPDERGFAKVAEVIAGAFAHQEDLVCIMAAGIVVRGLAPHLKGKDRDPAVVVVDEAGRFAVSLLSGHLGGANDLARRVAAILGAEAVITTATDVQGLPALDVIARQSGLVIENLEAVRPIHLALLQGRPARLVDPEGCLKEALAGHLHRFVDEPDLDAALSLDEPTVYVGWRERPWPPGWLVLRPKNLIAGMGCHQGVIAAELVEFISRIFAQEGLSLGSLKALATIAAKKDEPGLIAAARKLGVPLLWFSAEELNRIPTPHPSPQATKHVGAASVSEAAALKAGGMKLLIPKIKAKNATLAVALAPWP